MTTKYQFDKGSEPVISTYLKEATMDNLSRFIENEIPEGKTLDYKEAVDLSKKEHKAEFLADLSSFSNTFGGDLFIGIKEENGIPTQIQGIPIDNLDKWLQNIENLIRDSISPRIQREIHTIEIDINLYVILIHIPQSWNGPHRVMQNFRYYMRHAAGKYPLDHDELKQAFLASDSLADKIRHFKNSRVSQIKHEKRIPFRPYQSKIILHFIPRTSLLERHIFSNNELKSYHPKSYNNYDGGYVRPNLDGRIRYSRLNTGYTQLFRNGIVEAMSTDDFIEHTNRTVLKPNFENEILKLTQSVFTYYNNISQAGPFHVFITITNAKNVRMARDDKPIILPGEQVPAIDQDDLILPEIQFDNSNCDDIQWLALNFFPAFEAVWNACGYERAHTYKDKEWIGGPGFSF